MVIKIRKWIISLAFMVLLLGSTIPVAFAGDSSETTVLLVSNNLADSAVAESISNQMEDVIIFYTEWGQFVPSVVDAIVQLCPSQVLILGGPMAVVSEYESALEGLDVVRIGGKDREETSFMAMKGLINRYLLKHKVVVANGADENAIATALNESLKAGCPIVFITGNEVSNETKGKLKKDGITSYSLALGAEGEDEETPEDQEEDPEEEGVVDIDVMARAQEMIALAEESISVLTASITDNPPTAVMVLYANAVNKLERAIAAMEEGKYGRAYGLSNAANTLANNAVRILDSSFEEEDSSGTMLGNLAQKALDWITEVSDKRDAAYEAYGDTLVDYPEIADMLTQVDELITNTQQYYNAGDYESALNELIKAKEILHNVSTYDSNGGNDKENNGKGKGNTDKENNGKGKP
ncbi:MAG: hypothetical protein ACXQT0_06225 [Candidatus Methanofastidiosia archaeon]